VLSLLTLNQVTAFGVITANYETGSIPTGINFQVASGVQSLISSAFGPTDSPEASSSPPPAGAQMPPYSSSLQTVTCGLKLDVFANPLSKLK
jgi:hypothetical protein